MLRLYTAWQTVSLLLPSFTIWDPSKMSDFIIPRSVESGTTGSTHPNNEASVNNNSAAAAAADQGSQRKDYGWQEKMYEKEAGEKKS
jgi:hypothetical protein